MARYGFREMTPEARNMLDRMEIPVQQRDTMFDIELFDSKVIQVPSDDDPKKIEYYYLLEGAPFFMDIRDGILRAVEESQREYWVNRLKESESNIFGSKPPY